MDDEPGFVNALARLLRNDGSTVDTAADGDAALIHLQAHHYDVVLCDLRMPALDGPDFYAILSREQADLRHRVLFLTGDTLGADSTAFLEQCGQPWVYKPCDAAAIRRAIQQMLEAAASTSEEAAATGEPLPEEGTLSIVLRDQHYHVRYASNNPYAPEHPMRDCGDRDTLDALLHALGLEAAAMHDACAIVPHGGVAVLRILLAPRQIQTCFHPAAYQERCSPHSWSAGGPHARLHHPGCLRVIRLC
jgi:CheY-like chemotaxis protein